MQYKRFEGQPTQQRWQSRWKEIHNAEQRTPKEIYTTKLNTAWRIIRTQLLAKQQINPEERLSALPESQWYEPVPDASTKDRSVTAAVIADDFAGLSLLPTTINYQRYTSAFFRTAETLAIPAADMVGFDQHDYPSYNELVRYEYNYIHELVKELLHIGAVQLKKLLLDTTNLTEFEIPSLLRLVRAEASSNVTFDTEQDRRMLVTRLEDYLQRSQDAADLRAEMQGIKALSVVQGLNKVEPEGQMQIVVQIARDLADEEKRKHERAETREANFRVLDDGDSSHSSDRLAITSREHNDDARDCTDDFSSGDTRVCDQPGSG